MFAFVSFEQKCENVPFLKRIFKRDENDFFLEDADFTYADIKYKKIIFPIYKNDADKHIKNRIICMKTYLSSARISDALFEKSERIGEPFLSQYFTKPSSEDFKNRLFLTALQSLLIEKNTDPRSLTCAVYDEKIRSYTLFVFGILAKKSNTLIFVSKREASKDAAGEIADKTGTALILSDKTDILSICDLVVVLGAAEEIDDFRLRDNATLVVKGEAADYLPEHLKKNALSSFKINDDEMDGEIPQNIDKIEFLNMVYKSAPDRDFIRSVKFDR